MMSGQQGRVLCEIRSGVVSSHSKRFGVVMSNVDYRKIEKVPDRCGGRAVVAGTRIRVSVILGCRRQGMMAEQIVEQYPHLPLADVKEALAYSHDHGAEIEADLAADDESMIQPLWADMRESPMT